jgi:hypothetical protein
MARIRSIKPELPQSESMGRVSRDARLLFILIWTLCDDEGRTRAASRMLASLLFPYDDDAPTLVDGWLAELARERCIVLYQHEGSSYLQVCKWLNHQKIDKPSRSKIPAFDESSRILANPREVSCEDQGSRIKDQGEEPPTEGASAPDDETHSLWRDGPKLLGQLSLPERSARSNIGRWLKSRTAGQVLDAIRSAHRAGTQDPIPYVNQTLAGNPGERLVEYLG